MSDNVRKVVILSQDQWAEIAQWRWDNRINTESDSMRNLIAAGIHYYKLMADPEFQQAEAAALNRLNGDAN
jgi:TRAP-type C4-dicarboxylate transport system substrate-binding protein